jgi:RNA polymerase sigma-70 factor (sigma-E family)
MVPEEFADLAHRLWPGMVRTARLLGCPPFDAEDAAQAALLRCLVHWNRVRQAQDPDAYAYRVLINAVRTSRRRGTIREVTVSDVPERVIEPGQDDLEARDTYARMLSGLSDRHREVVVLRYYHDLSVEQIAAVLRVPEGTVKSRLSRAIATVAASHPKIDGSRSS